MYTSILAVVTTVAIPWLFVIDYGYALFGWFIFFNFYNNSNIYKFQV